ncbi:MAG: NAD(P)/FAD-dependent oxidoreductase [Litorimonas sp.]
MTTHYNLIVIGAGLSGIGMACHYKRDCGREDYAILEARDVMGGTWDLFRYPGVRSDSDMHTLGYNFKPWTNAKAIADGPSILNYIQETASEYGVDKHIQYETKLVSMNWTAREARWKIVVEDKTGARRDMSANFVVSCAGYYNYDEGYNPSFEGQTNFDGPIIHPQHWPQDLNYSDRKIVVIGSGATAMTLVPNLAKSASHVTMLQRSPSYVVSVPSRDHLANVLRKILPDTLAYKLIRAKNIMRTDVMNAQSRDKPERVRKFLLRGVRKGLGKAYDVNTHFTPDYMPWDQRLCLVPDADLFNVLKSNKAQVVTDHIERFTQDGILLKSGQHIAADIIVTATGLQIQVMGNIDMQVDGAPVDFASRFTYRGMMLSDVPNFANIFGYVNASWTLRSDLIAQYMCRLMTHMKTSGYKTITPRAPEDMDKRLWLDFDAGYIQRAIDIMPKQGDRDPWQNIQNYKRDRSHIGRASVASDIDNGSLEVS